MAFKDMADSRQGPTITGISAITLNVRRMARSVHFYRRLGFQVHFGGNDAPFTTLRNGACHINLSLVGETEDIGRWGRVILRVLDVDAWYNFVTNASLEVATGPKDGAWGERYFHLRDPDGHELSLAEELPAGRQG